MQVLCLKMVPAIFGAALVVYRYLVRANLPVKKAYWVRLKSIWLAFGLGTNLQ